MKLARLLRCLPLLLTVLPLLPPVVHAQNYPRIAYYGALKRSGSPVMDDDGNLIDSVANAMARYPEVIIDMDPITPYRPQFLTSMRQRNPSVKLLAYVTGHYIWSSLDPDSFNHYPTRYWRMIRDMDGFLYNKAGAQFGLTNHAFANVNLAKKAQGRYVVAESLATLFWDFAVRRGGWDGIFVDTFCQGILWAQAPGESIDFARAGYSSPSTFDAAWHAGTDTLAARLRQKCGNSTILVGNCEPNTKWAWFNGWMRENFPFQGGATWYNNMYDDPGGYFTEEQRFRTPTNNHISTSIVNGYGAQYWSDNCRRARLGLGSAALGDGYASFVPGQRTPLIPYYTYWYDEFAVDLTTGTSSPLLAKTGWLGQPLGPYYQMIWAGTNPDAVTNPGAETNLSGWTFWCNSAQINSTFTRDAGTAAVGGASFKVTVPNTTTVDWYVNFASNGSIWGQLGYTYSATFWAKASTPRNITVVASNTGASRVVAIGTTWKQYQAALVPLWSGQANLAFFLGVGAGDVWIDDAHLQQGATSIYRRDFQKGMVLVNPSYNVLPVPLAHSYRKILGTADPITNNGTSITTATVNPLDALFLIDSNATAGVAGATVAPRLELSTPWPNPGRGEGPVSVRMALPRPGRATLELFDALGRRVAMRAPEVLPAGANAVTWDVGPHPPGLYFVRLSSEMGTATAKWVVLD